MTTGIFDRDSGHEQVVFCQDATTGLRAIIAIHSTALGPALGGARFFPYETEDAALNDVLALSKGMTYKNALAGLDLGGGKAVIIGDPASDKSEALLRAYGRFVRSLGGRYITACDVGTGVSDMDLINRETRFVIGRPADSGGAGDSSMLTAFGVFEGMRASASQVWGEATLRGRRVGVAGAGKVGRVLIDHLVEAGAQVSLCDVAAEAIERVVATHPHVEVVPTVSELVRSEIDIYAPCALGGALSDDTVAALRAKIVCGAANNQLAHPEIGKALDDRGILFAPDYLVNSGGVIQVSDELHGFDLARAKRKVSTLYDTTTSVLAAARADGVPPATAADRIAQRRIAELSGLPGIYTG